MTSSLVPIHRRSLKDTAVAKIRSAISRVELRAGERLTELGLAQRLGVGQATIREALIELEHQGFIQRRGPGKTFVTALSQRDINDIYLVRKRLETLVVELLVAQKRRDLSDSHRAYQRMLKSAESGQPIDFYDADLDFHRGLWQATRNRFLAEALEQLVPRLFAFDIIQKAAPPRQKLSQMAETHRELLELIRSGLLEAAKAAMEESMQQARVDDAGLSE